MKKILIALSLLIGISASSLSVQAAGAPFFLKNVVEDTSIQNQINKIKLKSYTFKNTDTRAKFSSTTLFIAQVKKEVNTRYSDGVISLYETRDALHELTYLTYSMNEYFRNMKSFEQTKKSIYQSLADDNLTSAAASYNRLSSITWSSVRK